MYVSRFIEPAITQALQDFPVVIVHGSRYVGKTSLVRRLRERGVLAASYSLTDEDVLSAAQQDLKGWLRSLKQPFAIDEAQLLPELPLALKGLMDERGDQISCLLTGSAAIGRTGLGGSDPLAFRAHTVQLAPLTEAELHTGSAQPWSVIDQLFDGDPAHQHQADDPQWWEPGIRHGGLPNIRLKAAGSGRGTVGVLESARSVLTEHVLPGQRYDVGNAERVLDYVLRHSSEELKAGVIAREVGLDSRTVDRYLDVLEQRFLVHEVHNLKAPAKKTPRTTAKGYAADAALAAAAVNLHDFAGASAALRGQLFETFVVQQLQAHLGWSSLGVKLYHWRETRNGKTKEVDVVLEDARGRIVGIEVKSGSRLKSEFTNGLEALRAQYPDRFHRGYVLTGNAAAVPFGQDIWAVPAAALQETRAWEGLLRETARTEAESRSAGRSGRHMSSHAESLLLQTHIAEADMAAVYGGRPDQFAQDLAEALAGLTGISVTAEVNETGQADGHVLKLSFLSPAYLREFGENVENGALPLRWIDPLGGLPAVLAEEAVDASPARLADRGSADYRRVLDHVARTLAERMTQPA